MDPSIFSSPALASSSSSSGSAMASPTFTEQDLQFAASAKRDFLDRNMEACLNSLGALKLSRPEDPLVAQNVAVVRFERREIGVDSVMRELSGVKRQINNGAEFDEAEHVALVYNLALAHFLKRDFAKAEKLLSKLRVVCGGAAASTASAPILVNFVLPLLASVSLLLHMPGQALSCLNELCELDKTKAGGGKANGSLVLMRAQALVMSRQQKTFKKDIKSSDLELGEQLTADFLKANMEYLKGNLKKAHKLLTPSNERASALTPYLNSLFFNNLGCIHLLLGKPHLSLHYFQNAFNEHHKQITSSEPGPAEVQQRPDFGLLIRKTEILYNHSLAQLHCGCYKEAFEGFLRVIPTFRGNPHLWLHLAECCIAACTQGELDVKALLKKQEVAKGGSGINKAEQRDALMANFKVFGGGNPMEKQKVVLNCERNDRGCPNVFSGGNDPAAAASKPALTFSFASMCLQNALYLLSLVEADPLGPNPMPLSSKVVLLRAVILVKSAFVALRLNDPVMAVRYAEEVLHLPRSSVPGGYIALAHLYGAEGHILLDRISEAMALLNPTSLDDVSFDSDSVKDDGNGDFHAKRAASGIVSANAYALQATKALFMFNVAVAQLNRGLLDKAEAALEQLWTSKATQQFCSRVFMARLYVQIKKGNMDACRELIQKDCLLTL